MKVKFICSMLLAFILTLVCGCVSAAHPAVKPPVFNTAPPSQLAGVATWLDIFMIVAIPIVAGAVVLFFLAPADFKYSLGLGSGGITLFVTSALLKVSLWLIPWVAGGIVVLALAALGYEIYARVTGKVPTIESEVDLGKVSPGVTTTATK